MQRNSALAQELRPYIVALVNQAVAGSASGGSAGATIIAHDIGGDFHTGTLRDAQMPQVLLRNGTRSLAGNLAVDDGITVDGVDISAHAADPDAHHNQTHGIISGDHTASGLTAGHVVRASAPTAFAFAQLQHTDLGGVTANQHHNQVHGIVGADHTVTGAALDVIGLSGTNTLGVLTPSSNPGATAKILKTAADGSITLQAVTVNESFYAAATAFRVINHTHDYPHAHVVVNPGVSWTLDEQFGVDIDDNLLVRGWIVGKHAIQLAGALLIAHYDGPEPYESNFVGEANGHMGQVGSPTGGIIYRAGKFGKALQVAAAATNLVTNPRPDPSGSATGWNYFGGSAPTNVYTANAPAGYVGTRSIYYQNLTQGWPNTISVTSGSSYSISGWMLSSETQTITFALQRNGGAFDVISTVQPTQALTAGVWTYFAIALTANATDTARVRFAGNGTGDVEIGNVQVEAGALSSPYCDGGLGGYTAGGVADGSGHSWSGTAHASTSSRAAGSLIYPTSGNVAQSVGTVMAWVNPSYAHPTGAQTIFRATGTTAGHIILRLNSIGKPQGYWGTTAITAASAISTATWTHLAMSYDGATVSLYVNGTLSTSGASSGFNGMPTNMYVGVYSGAEWFGGLIDDLVILDRAAAADEIRAVYESNAPVFAETSTWHWRSGRNRVYSDAEGLWMLGASGSAVLGAYAGDDANPSATKSWGGVTMAEGDIVIGHNQSGSAAMVWDRSAGKFQFVGNGSATVQAEIDTQGRVSAGAGKIVLGSNGARLALGSSRTTYLSTTDGARIMWSAAEIYETLEEEYTYFSTTYYRRSLVARTVTGFGANVSHTEISALHETTSGSGVYRGPRIILESGAHIEDYTTTYSVDDLITMDADMIHITAPRVRIENDTGTSYVEVYQGNSSGNVPPLTLSQSDLSEELIGFVGTVATGNPINTDALGSYYGRVRVSVNGTLKWMALYN